jgi:hypothetical protein
MTGTNNHVHTAFDFRNGGHMVPETQPERGYALFTRFISEGHLFDESDIDEIVNPPEPSPTPAYL